MTKGRSAASPGSALRSASAERCVASVSFSPLWMSAFPGHYPNRDFLGATYEDSAHVIYGHAHSVKARRAAELGFDPERIKHRN